MKKVLSVILTIIMIIPLGLVFDASVSVQASTAESWLWPTPSPQGLTITSSFGYRNTSNATHNAIDINCKMGTPVLATKSGTVFKCVKSYASDWHTDASGTTSWGNYIILKHKDGTYSLYAHLSKGAPVSQGDVVTQGSTIAYSGDSGHSSGPHLHFSARSMYVSSWSKNVNEIINVMPTEEFIKKYNMSYTRYKLPAGWPSTRMSYNYKQTGSTPTTPTTLTSTTNPDSYPFPSKSVNNANYRAGVVTANEIKWVQAVLYQFGFLTSSGIDGKFGPNSVAATKNFQSVYGLTADGSAGPNTLNKMKSLWNAKKGTHTHTVVDATCTKPMHCSSCGVTAGTALGHMYSDACDQTCDRCENTRSVTHSFAAATCTKAKTCKVCGVTSGEALGHTYSNACDTSCNVCNATRTITHAYKTTITKATLTKNGSIVKKCTACGKVASNTAIKYAKSFKLSATSYTYNGKVKTPDVTVKDSAGKTLKKNTDYTVTYAAGRKNAGTYKVTIKMKGNYSGTKTLTFKINPIDISRCTVKLSATSYTYSGKVNTPSVTVKNANGTKLTKNTHYTVTYASGRKNVGTYKVTIKMKGNYTGTKTLTFKIVPKAASINKLTAKTKALTVKLNRSLQQSSGYQIQYATNKNFTGAKTKVLSDYKTSNTTLTGLKAKTTYFVRVRTYKKIGSTTYYSSWSSYKYLKTK